MTVPTGWLCPVCGAALAPQVTQCVHAGTPNAVRNAGPNAARNTAQETPAAVVPAGGSRSGLSSARRSAGKDDYDSEPGFNAFWEVYPRKLDKAPALRAYRIAVRNGADPAVLAAAALRYANDPNRTELYTKYPATWLNAKAWENGSLPRRDEPGRVERTLGMLGDDDDPDEGGAMVPA